MIKGYIVIFVTASSPAEARKIVDVLLNKKLVACGNVIEGVKSRFWWHGKLDKANESLIMLKAPAKNFKKIEAEVKRKHSYEVPEIIAIPITAGSGDYLKWIKESTK